MILSLTLVYLFGAEKLPVFDLLAFYDHLLSTDGFVKLILNLY